MALLSNPVNKLAFGWVLAELPEFLDVSQEKPVPSSDISRV